jgi:hypothetical protein
LGWSCYEGIYLEYLYEQPQEHPVEEVLRTWGGAISLRDLQAE